MKRAATFIKELIIVYISDRVAFTSAALSYYLLFALFPFTIFLSMVLGLFHIQEMEFFAELAAVIPKDIITILTEYLEFVSENQNTGLLFFGLFFTLYFIVREVNGLMIAINHAYRMEENRGFLKHYIVVVLFSVFIMVGVFLSLMLITIGKHILTYVAEIFRLSDSFVNLWHYGRFLIIAVIIFSILSIMYRISTTGKPPWRYVFPGAGAALAAWLIISIGFSFYVENMGRYSLLYGSIGAVIVLLLWLYMSSITIVMGAEFNHVLMANKKLRKR